MKAKKWDIIADTIENGEHVKKHLEYFEGDYSAACARCDEIEKEHWQNADAVDLYEEIEAYVVDGKVHIVNGKLVEPEKQNTEAWLNVERGKK